MVSLFCGDQHAFNCRQGANTIKGDPSKPMPMRTVYMGVCNCAKRISVVFVVAVIRICCARHERHGGIGQVPLGGGACFAHRNTDHGELLVPREVLLEFAPKVFGQAVCQNR